MIKIYGVGRGRGKEGENKPAAPKRQPGEIRIQKELDELELPPHTSIAVPDKNNLMAFHITIAPDEGFWKGATYKFVFNVPGAYPHEPPKVKCETKIYHPNIDLQGNVCLNILREDWKPVLSINTIVYGLLYLFLEPNPGDPLNHEAADALRTDRVNFARLVGRSLKGGVVAGESFPKLT
ncbi:unnamed protein product [Vitrella brassicaformis CCMP3155]|uniref:UBC core domain-containing protein n=1 Tax=Vitrella brassicaformis (strain CCMP3155) TaxID=1169540 RepID=A0A0G4EZR1_VITBC|nr:unnamed protein product [Vitrella brassicaformis CCMP3155]|eukprot:CEM04506.1 unnamed protein product [Vitrella brassicaformis CCMP3155]